MKNHIALITLFTLTACTSTPKPEETFVNPIFYSLMERTNKEFDAIKITPTSYFVRNYYGYYTMANCEMLENTMTKVTLKCLFHPAAPNNKDELVMVEPEDEPIAYIQSYKLSENQNYSKGTFIQEYTYRLNDDKWFSRQPYVTVDAPTRKWNVNSTIEKAKAQLKAKEERKAKAF